MQNRAEITPFYTQNHTRKGEPNSETGVGMCLSLGLYPGFLDILHFLHFPHILHFLLKSVINSIPVSERFRPETRGFGFIPEVVLRLSFCSLFRHFLLISALSAQTRGESGRYFSPRRGESAVSRVMKVCQPPANPSYSLCDSQPPPLSCKTATFLTFCSFMHFLHFLDLPLV